MSYLLINENGVVIGINANRVEVKYKDGMLRTIPVETLESVIIMGKSQMTTACTIEFLKRGITVSYFSKGGTYFGRLQSLGHVNAKRQRKQSQLANSEFSIELGKRVISGKIKNQQVVMRRYAKSKIIDISEENKYLSICIEKIKYCNTVNELMGYEGTAAKYYFKALAKCVETDFSFSGRNRRPPRDPFNSMISLGYSLLMNEMYDIIERKGLNPYFGFIHSDKENHPTLVSDMIEEWRAIIVDSVVMSLINGKEIHIENFISNIDEPGCYLTKDGIKIFTNKLEKKMNTSVKYLSYIGYSVDFRHAIDLQIGELVKAIDDENPEIYSPVIIR